MNFIMFSFFSILHGLGRLTGPPRFWIFFIGKAFFGIFRLFLAIFNNFWLFLAIIDHFLAIFSPRHYLRDRQTCNTANTLHEAGHFRYRASTLRCDQNQILSVSTILEYSHCQKSWSEIQFLL